MLQPLMCRTAACENRTKWELQPQQSTFVDWQVREGSQQTLCFVWPSLNACFLGQVLRVQENASEIPAGSMPRSIKVVLRNDVSRAVLDPE